MGLPVPPLPWWGWLIAVVAVAAGLFLLRTLPHQPSRWGGGRHRSGERRTPSLAHLIWPTALLPLSGWLTYYVVRCPGNPVLGEPIAKAVATYFGPPVLLAAFVLILGFRSWPSAVRIGGAVALAMGFVAACVWAWLLFGLAIMAECG
jgi:hypothetical protein